MKLHFRVLASAITIALLLAGCVAIPVNRTILLGRTSKVVELNPHMIELRTGTSTPAFKPISVNVENAAPHFHKSIAVIFPVSAAEIQMISLAFLPGFIILDGAPSKPVPLRFRKVTRMEVYYGSINC